MISVFLKIISFAWVSSPWMLAVILVSLLIFDIIASYLKAHSYYLDAFRSGQMNQGSLFVINFITHPYVKKAIEAIAAFTNFTLKPFYNIFGELTPHIGALLSKGFGFFIQEYLMEKTTFFSYELKGSSRKKPHLVSHLSSAAAQEYRFSNPFGQTLEELAVDMSSYINRDHPLLRLYENRSSTTVDPQLLRSDDVSIYAHSNLENQYQYAQGAQCGTERILEKTADRYIVCHVHFKGKKTSASDFSDNERKDVSV